VYPNLRALKGHNKEHLGKPPYICNVGSCNYSSNDKSTLTRHMRTHTGEKPFECKLCNYGFTTKANCERHLKNKHGKTSRDAIRTSIITHETECDLDGKQIMQNTSENGNSGINNLSTKIIRIHDRELFKYRPQNQLDLEPIFNFHLPRSSRICSLVRGKKNQRNSCFPRSPQKPI
jgi:uncharacterized Zn-finger protein